jgi:hypothetical protein
LKPLHKYILHLLLFNTIVPGTGCIIISQFHLNLVCSDIIILSAIFSVIALITILIFFRGQVKEPDNQTLHTLVSVILKFLMELVLALIWFFIAKKTSLTSVIMFFVIYLTLTLFSIGVILKTLKNKSL